MTRVFGGDYADQHDDVYHQHRECPDGQGIPPERRLHHVDARAGRVLCATCAATSPPPPAAPRFFGH